MKPIEKLLDRIKTCGENDEYTDDPFRMMGYITEELGEFAAAITAEEGGKGGKPCDESARDENIDIIIAAFGNYFAGGGTLEYLYPQMNKKLKKWEARVTVGEVSWE